MVASFFIIIILGLNSGLHTYKAGTIPLEPLHQPSFVLGIFEIVSGFEELCP
jgi:hypothetical protein